MVDQILSIFKETENGKLSSGRIALLIATIAIMFVWGMVSWHNKRLEPIPWEVITFHGVLVTGKVYQTKTNSLNEKKKE